MNLTTLSRERFDVWPGLTEPDVDLSITVTKFGSSHEKMVA